MDVDQQMQKVVQTAHTAFRQGKVRTYEQRRRFILQVDKFLVEQETALIDAVTADLKKPYQEAYMFEIAMCRAEVKHCLDHLKSWMSPEHVSKPLANIGDVACVQAQPYGVVTLLCPWNYPISLVLIPLIGAIAAGNCIIVKPSEVAVACEKVFKNHLNNYLPSDCFPVVCGGVVETSALLRQRVDYIFYTGSTPVGRIVMKAAAENLTPVTLELGGKCPTFVDASSDMQCVANRIISFKAQNAGQACISYDYLLCTQETQDRLLGPMQEAIERFFGEDLKESPDFGRIINARHYDRIMGVLEKSKGRRAIDCGSDKSDLFIGFVVLTNVKPDDSTMQDEIFGPILPIVIVKDLDEAIDFINEREKPLAAYVYAKDKAVVKKFEENTTSGALVSNDAALNMAIAGLPFGGVGHSGMGAYHGKFTFDTFSHKRAVLHRQQKMEGVNVRFRYPPMTKAKVHRLSNFLFPTMDSSDPKKMVLVVLGLLGVLVAGVAVYCQSQQQSVA